MGEVIYPQVMGLFCTGYFLHLIWRAYLRRQAKQFLTHLELMQIRVDATMQIVWSDWPNLAPTPTRSGEM